MEFKDEEDNNNRRRSEEEVEQDLTLSEYHDINNISWLQDRPNLDELEELGMKLADLFNSYPKMKGIDKILMSKNVTLQLINTGVKQFIRFKNNKARKEMEEEMK